MRSSRASVCTVEQQSSGSVGQRLGLLRPAPKKQWERLVFFSLEFLPCLPLKLLTQRELLVRQAATTSVAEGWEMLKRWSFVCLCSENPGQSASSEQGQDSCPGRLPGAASQAACHTCSELHGSCYVQSCCWNAHLQQRQVFFLGVGAANNRFMKLLLLIFQLRGERWVGAVWSVVSPLLLSMYLCVTRNTHGHSHTDFFYYILLSAATHQGRVDTVRNQLLECWVNSSA